MNGKPRACPITSATTPCASSNGRSASATCCRRRTSHYRCHTQRDDGRDVVAIAHTPAGERCLTRARLAAHSLTADSRIARAPPRVSLDAAAGRAVARTCRVGRGVAHRVRAAVAGAGIHARHLRVGGADRASARRAARSRPPGARSRAASSARASSTSSPSRVQPSDPYIAAIRVGQPADGFLRVVLDLKAEVRPQVFALAPVAEFGHRLVHRPVSASMPLDPLMALLERERVRPRRRRRRRSRSAAIAGANGRAGDATRQTPPTAASPSRSTRVTAARTRARVGRRGTYEKNVMLAIARKLKRCIDRSRTCARC